MIGYLNIKCKQKVGRNIKAIRKVWLQHNILVSIKDKIRVIVTKIQ